MNHFQKIFFLLIFFFGFFGLAKSSQAATINAASCNSSDVQAAVTAASDGDIVSIPACSNTTWSGTDYSPVVNVNKSLTIIGAGIDETNITPASTYALKLNSTGSKVIDISGITFLADNQTSQNRPRIQLTGDATGSIRFHHNKYDDLNVAGEGQAELYLDVDTRANALIDHNTFNKYRYPQIINLYSSLEYSTIRKPVGYGAGWATTEWAFIEDNVFRLPCDPYDDEHVIALKSAVNDNKYAGKGVFRHNMIYNGVFLQHGLCETSSNVFGGMALEIYNNTTIMQNGCTAVAYTEVMGGTVLVHDNDIRFWGTGRLNPVYNSINGCSGDTSCLNHWQTNTRTLHQSCRDNWIGGVCDGTVWQWATSATDTSWLLCKAGDSNCTKHHCQYSWDLCTVDSDCTSKGGGTCTGTLDNRDNSSGRVCFDGNGSGTLDAGTPGSVNAHIDYEPIYFWNNTLVTCAADGTGCGTPKTFAAALVDFGDNFKLGVDYFNSAKPGYSPYTYPHPLALSSDTTPPSAPSGLSIS